MMQNPNVQFLMQHPAHFIALGFGSGLAKKAPGTFGTLIGFPLYGVIANSPLPIKLGIIAALFLAGVYVCDKTGKSLGVSDHGSMVWDEIVAMMLVLMFTPKAWVFWLAAFVLFRLFDIWKPYPIRQMEAQVKGGLGVMLDDILAAVYAILSIQMLMCIGL